MSFGLQGLVQSWPVPDRLSTTAASSSGSKPGARVLDLPIRLREISEGYQSAREGSLCGIRPGGNAQLRVNVGEMALDRTLRNVKMRGYLAVAHRPRREQKDF